MVGVGVAVGGGGLLISWGGGGGVRKVVGLVPERIFQS